MTKRFVFFALLLLFFAIFLLLFFCNVPLLPIALYQGHVFCFS